MTEEDVDIILFIFLFLKSGSFSLETPRKNKNIKRTKGNESECIYYTITVVLGTDDTFPCTRRQFL